MCNSSLRLVAWIDGELPESEATEVEQHVQSCADCQTRVSAYEGASNGFATYYAATNRTALAANPQPGRRIPRWIPYAVAVAAAAVLAFILIPRSQKHAPAAPQVAKAVVPLAMEPAPKAVEPTRPVAQHVKIAKAHVAPRHQPIHEDWAIAQPGIQIAIPADAMFPPGAVPEGVAYIANVSFAADGSVQGFRLHP